MTTSFSAADSALGYLYQVRVALLWSLRRARAGTDFVVSLETLDDVTFDSLQADLNEEWYRNAIVERWRGGKKLVPEDWKRADD